MIIRMMGRLIAVMVALITSNYLIEPTQEVNKINGILGQLLLHCAVVLDLYHM